MVLGAQVARSGASEAEDNQLFQIRARNNEIFCIRRRNADRSHSVEVFFLGPGCAAALAGAEQQKLSV